MNKAFLIFIFALSITNLKCMSSETTRKLCQSRVSNSIEQIEKKISDKEKTIEQISNRIRSLLHQAFMSKNSLSRYISCETPSFCKKSILEHQRKRTILQRSIAVQKKALNSIYTEMIDISNNHHWATNTIQNDDKLLAKVNLNNHNKSTLKNNIPKSSLAHKNKPYTTNPSSKHNKKINFSQRRSHKNNVPNMYKQRHR